jgi:hypothetical protein
VRGAREREKGGPARLLCTKKRRSELVQGASPQLALSADRTATARGPGVWSFEELIRSLQGHWAVHTVSGWPHALQTGVLIIHHSSLHHALLHFSFPSPRTIASLSDRILYGMFVSNIRRIDLSASLIVVPFLMREPSLQWDVHGW